MAQPAGSRRTPAGQAEPPEPGRHAGPDAQRPGQADQAQHLLDVGQVRLGVDVREDVQVVCQVQHHQALPALLDVELDQLGLVALCQLAHLVVVHRVKVDARLVQHVPVRQLDPRQVPGLERLDAVLALPHMAGVLGKVEPPHERPASQAGKGVKGLLDRTEPGLGRVAHRQQHGAGVVQLEAVFHQKAERDVHRGVVAVVQQLVHELADQLGALLGLGGVNGHDLVQLAPGHHGLDVVHLVVR